MLAVQILLSVGVGLIATALFGWAIDREPIADESENGAPIRGISRRAPS
jgi:hypothetical protein